MGLQQAPDQAEIPSRVVNDDTVFVVYFTDGGIKDYLPTGSVAPGLIQWSNRFLLVQEMLKCMQKFYASRAHTEGNIQDAPEVFGYAAEQRRGN